MTNHKPWKSYVDQLELLKSRGLLVDDEAKALNYLERIGYYRLSGYLYPFRELEITQDDSGKLGYIRRDEFKENSHFKDAVKLYVFDKKLRLLAMDALERIELAVRVDIAHLLGELDVHAQENAGLFHGNFSKKEDDHGITKHQAWLEQHDALIHRARRVPFVEHYLDKYGKLPIWVAIEIWDFGLMSKLFAGMKRNNQIPIANKYGAADVRVFVGWLRSLNFIRNISAHHSRLWNINILERASLLQDNDYWKQQNNARPFYYFCIMQKLLKIICPKSNWHGRFKELMDEFPAVENNAVSLNDFGLIENWKEWDLWSQK